MRIFNTLPDWLAHLETAHLIPIDLGCERFKAVKDVLKLEFKCPVLTVGGTNGKGSICALLESILLHAGYRVGCHTSPHLISFNERARINGEMLSDEALLPHFEAVERARHRFSEPVSLTYFEFTVLAILHSFAAHPLEAVILEVGLGGRLDAVNVIDTDCAVISSIDLDHVEFLGDTREKIGFEKAGIFRPGKPAICGDPLPPRSLVEYAQRIRADLWLAGRDFHCAAQTGYERQQWRYQGRAQARAALAYPALRGANQLLNASAALAALEALRERLPVSARDIRLGLANVNLPGRFQVLPGKPTVVLDIAHNPHAVAALAHTLDQMGFFPHTYAVFGAMRDKNIAGMLRCMKGAIQHWHITDLPTPRAAPAAKIEMLLREIVHISKDLSKRAHAADIRCFTDAAHAYLEACARADENDRIVVFGSFYTVAAVMSLVCTDPH